MTEEILTKVCSKCGIEKPRVAFSVRNGSRDGLYAYCKECAAKAGKARHEKNKARETIVIPEFKTCFVCKTEKPGLSFSKCKSNDDGLQNYCKDCLTKSKRASYEKNKARKNVVTPELKTCPGCNTEKSNFLFSKAIGNTDGLQNYCKECSLVNKRKSKYRASPEWQKSTLEAQGGACAICQFIPGPGDRALHLDHKHGGAPRGFLHGNCNMGLGCFKDSIEIIGKAIEYLNSPTTGILYKKSWSKGVPKVIREQILAAQDYLCKICSVDLHDKKARIDHDHLTLLVRGALCNCCNSGLGMFDDSVELLQKAITYLKTYEQV